MSTDLHTKHSRAIQPDSAGFRRSRLSRICLICKRHFSGGDLLRKLLWAVWRKKAVFFTIVLSIITFSVFILHHELDIPFGEPLRLYSTLLLKANEIASKSPFVNVAITVLIPLLFTLALRHLVIYMLLPGDKAGVVDALLDRCTEVSEVASARVSERLAEIAEWADGLRTGVDIDKQECPILGREIIERSKATTLFVTCLQPAEKVYDDMRQFSEIIASETRARNIKMTRVIVTDVTLDQTNDKVRWFVELHRDENHQLRMIGKEQFKRIAALYAIPQDRLDVMLFNDRVVYALLNSPQDLAVYESETGWYRLYLMDSSPKLQAYGKFSKTLLSQSIEVSPNGDP